MKHLFFILLFSFGTVFLLSSCSVSHEKTDHVQSQLRSRAAYPRQVKQNKPKIRYGAVEGEIEAMRGWKPDPAQLQRIEDEKAIEAQVAKEQRAQAEKERVMTALERTANATEQTAGNTEGIEGIRDNTAAAARNAQDAAYYAQQAAERR